jgi:hypothetical protein
MFDLNDYLKNNRNGSLAKQITCKSGLKMSVQASFSHYCTPRNDDGPYQEVEVGFPSVKVDDLMEYAEDARRPTDTVYAHVPTTLVEQIVNDNGGLL